MAAQSNLMSRKRVVLIAFAQLLVACGGGGGNDTATPVAAAVTPPEPVVVANTAEDDALQGHINRLNLSGDPSAGRNLPAIEDALPQLGKLLFFSKSLGGGFDSACVTCHHPMLGGADELSLPVGVDSAVVELLGQGRESNVGVPVVPRNSPTIFNVGLWDSGLFWDSRVESLGKELGQNGSASGIRTPDSGFEIADTNAGANLVEAQSRFPVTSADEMKTTDFENGSSNEVIRGHLAARLGNYGIGLGELTNTQWLNEFQLAFGSTEQAEALINYSNIARAIGEYERSMVFVASPWKAYVEGDNTSLTDQQKEGANLFFAPPDQGGAGCSVCHEGDLFSNGSHQLVGFPQIGPGKGDGNADDYGRERESGDVQDRYRVRVPGLLNVAHTAPYGHSGSYATLREAVAHYDNPRNQVNDYFDDGGWCQLAQFETIPNCPNLYPNARANSNLALDKLRDEQQSGVSDLPNINLNNNEINQLVAFLQALTDPCITDPQCLAPWIADSTMTGPDGEQLNAVDEFLAPL